MLISEYYTIYFINSCTVCASKKKNDKYAVYFFLGQTVRWINACASKCNIKTQPTDVSCLQRSRVEVSSSSSSPPSEELSGLPDLALRPGAGGPGRGGAVEEVPQAWHRDDHHQGRQVRTKDKSNPNFLANPCHDTSCIAYLIIWQVLFNPANLFLKKKKVARTEDREISTSRSSTR